MLSVIVPCYNEKKYITHCVESILQQDYPKDDLEVLFVDGMSNDGTRDSLQSYCAQYPFLKMLDNPEKIVRFAMNKGIRAAQGEVIIRLDMHSAYEVSYFSTLAKQLQSLGADNVGCVCKTDVLNKTSKALAIKAALSSPFGVGNSSFRTGTPTVVEADTVPFGCFRRDVFERFGYYDTRLVRNQDIELNKRIKAGGGKIFLLPEALCTYYARETYCDLARNNYRNGLWNLLTVRMTRNFSSLSVRHFVPLLFLLSLVLPCIAALLWKPFVVLAMASLVSYLAVLTFISITIAKKDKSLSVPYLFWAFLTLHFSYAAGSFVGIFKSVK
ncbi:MAG: glycosyltransferase family 2 protein [Bacteroidales bacterium]|nr:glycosyltransferase family 2 protein [Bacteroidales bacterium]